MKLDINKKDPDDKRLSEEEYSNLINKAVEKREEKRIKEQKLCKK